MVNEATRLKAEVAKLKGEVSSEDEHIEVAKKELAEMSRLRDEMQKCYLEAKDEGFEHCHSYLSRALPDFDDQTDWVINKPSLMAYIDYYCKVDEAQSHGVGG